MIGSYNGTRIEYPDDMSAVEMRYYAEVGKKEWVSKGKSIAILGKIEITIDGGDVLINPLPHITRVRRITGYLSTEDRFNDGKLAELKDRVNHDNGEPNYLSAKELFLTRNA